MTGPQLVRRATALLIVDDVAASLPFWTDGLGYTIAARVPEGDDGATGFAMLHQNGTEVMLQSVTSVRDDVPEIASRLGRACLFIEVDDLEAVATRVRSAPVLVPRRETFYGMAEIVVEAPGGHVVTLAQRLEPSP